MLFSYNNKNVAVKDVCWYCEVFMIQVCFMLWSFQGSNCYCYAFIGLLSSDSVTRVNDSTQVTTFGDSDSTRVTLRKMVTRLESRSLQNDSIRLESQSITRDSSQSHFYKLSEFLIDKPTSFVHKEMSIFCFSDDQDWRKFSVLSV